MKKLAKLLSFVTALLMVTAFAFGCKPPKPDTGEYTYNDAVEVAPATWNLHTFQTTDDRYAVDLLYLGFYGFFFNDTYDGYEVHPEMASEEPIDVTAQYKSQTKWGIPSNATEGYAYKIPLNKDATWEDGTQINADSYIYSAQQLLDPLMLNKNAFTLYSGDMEIVNAKNYATQGQTEFFSFDQKGFTSIADANTAGFSRVWLDINEIWGCNAADAEKPIPDASADGNFVPIDDETLIFDHYYDNDPDNPEAWMSTKDIYEFCLDYYGFSTLQSYLYVSTGKVPLTTWPNVGLLKTGEYELTIILKKPSKGFYLLYNLSTPWLVKQDLYESCKVEVEGTYSSTYCTSAETSVSYGPYKVSSYQADKQMIFVRNDKWFGYKDSYKNGQYKNMYKTTRIVTDVVKEADARRAMFLKGDLIRYGLQASDYASYRTSERMYFSPGTTVFSLILNGSLNDLAAREAANVDKQIISLPKFRQALAVCYDKEQFAATISPARSGAYGLIGASDIWNVETGEKYRDTTQAKQVLCDFYGVEYGAGKQYKDIDAAIEAITGYDPVLSKQLFLEAYNDALSKGWITSTDKIVIQYAASVVNDFITKTIDYLNQKVNEVLAGTVLANRVVFEASTPLGNEWSNVIRDGRSDTVLAGWNGGMLNPFGTTEYYTNPTNQPYCDKWYKPTTIDLTLTLVGYKDTSPITMKLSEWSAALNGEVTKTHNFGYQQVSDNIRLQILAALEGAILNSYYYIPMLQDAAGFLLSKKVEYITQDFNAVLQRGGIQYMQYNFNDEEWAKYVAENLVGGELDYK